MTKKASNPQLIFTGIQDYCDLLHDLGGSEDDFLSAALLLSKQRRRTIVTLPYRDFVNMLEQSASALGVSDFGLRLAHRHAERPEENPLLLTIRNAETVGGAVLWAGRGARCVYSQAVYVDVKPPKRRSHGHADFEILLDRLDGKVQAVEYAVSAIYHRICDAAKSDLPSCEIWFRHKPIAPISVYQKYLRASIRFRQSVDAVRLDSSDWCRPISNRSGIVYDVASYYLATHYPASTGPTLRCETKKTAIRLLLQARCTFADVAAELGLPPRSFQRRLNEEGTSFEAIRDEARRELALKYLRDKMVPLKNISEILGYSESTAFTRSCRRWFLASPRRLRTQLRTLDHRNC